MARYYLNASWEECAKAAGRANRTLTKWRETEWFKRLEEDLLVERAERRRRARNICGDEAVEGLAESLRTFREHMGPGYPASIRIAAARAMSEASRWISEQEELCERLSKLEAVINVQLGDGGRLGLLAIGASALPWSSPMEPGCYQPEAEP